MDMSDISKLASLLRENGDKVLNALSKLSLTASLLQNLNEAFCLIVEQNEEDSSSFHVINTNNSKVELFHDLQFLHDFVQKVVGLKVSHSTPSATENFKSTLDISKFRSLKFLELRKVPVHMVNGIQSVRAQLQSVICVRCLQNLQDLLSSCGADHSSGFVWSELREAVLSYNGIETLDSSLTYTPWLQIVDLSHNRIKNIEVIDCLPNLKYLNVSYNLLDSLPVFNKAASRKLQVLVLKNNYIEDLSGLAYLESLSELDLSCNCLTDHDCLFPLLKLAALVWLSLEGNPLSFHSQHRLRTARYLHNNTASGKFLLDRTPLSKSERLQVGALSGSPAPHRVPAFRDDVSCHSTSSSSTSTKTQVAVPPEPQIAVPASTPQVVRRSRQVREAIISEHDGSMEEDTGTLTGSLDVSMEQAEHLETKRRIETLREQFGEDNWLHSHGGSCVQNVLGLPPAPPPTLPLLVAELLPQSGTSGPEPNKPTATPGIPDMVQDLPSKDDTISEVEETDSLDCKQGFPEIEPDSEEDQEEEEEGEVERQLYAVQRVRLGAQAAEELFLVVTDSQLRERDTQTGCTKERWGIDSLQSCVRTRSDPPTVQLTFDTVRRNRQEREYVLEEDDAQKLVRTLAEVLSCRPLVAMNQTAFRCMKCSAQFSHELLPSPIASVIIPPVTTSPGMKFPLPKDPTMKVLTCPTCGSTMVIVMDEEPLPATQTLISTSGCKDKPPLQTTSASALTQSPSQSSIGLRGGEPDGDRLQASSTIRGESPQLAAAPSRSAASLDSPGGSALAARRYDSDIEVISNPSQSSIEVLEGEARTPGRKRSSEERQGVAIQSSVPSVDPVGHVLGLTGLTESSSSGSLTDSVCTTYENHTVITPSRTSTSHRVEERTRKASSSENDSPTVKENGSNNTCKLPDVVSIPTTKQTEPNGTPEKSGLFHESHSPVVNFTAMFQGLLHSVSSKLVPTPPGKISTTSGPTNANAVAYSYDDFGRVDHRIKLHLYQSVFVDENEELSLLLRAEVLMQPTSCPFAGCLVLSNQKAYILKVTGKEGDDPERWLFKCESLPLSQLQAVFVLPWGQGIGLEVKDTTQAPRRILFLLQDAQRTSNLFTSLADSPLPKTCELKDEPPDYHQLAVRQLVLSSAASGEGDSVVRMLTIFSHCTVHSEKETQLGMGALLVTTSDLILTQDDLHWLFPGSLSPMNLHSSQKMNDLIELVLSGLTLTLQFVDETVGREESWHVSLRTDDAVQMVITAIRAPWEELFSVPLQVTERDQC